MIHTTVAMCFCKGPNALQPDWSPGRARMYPWYDMAESYSLLRMEEGLKTAEGINGWRGLPSVMQAATLLYICSCAFQGDVDLLSL